jgi:hypothetical protein
MTTYLKEDCGVKYKGTDPVQDTPDILKAKNKKTFKEKKLNND